MITRILEPNELYLARLVQTVCFEGSMDFEKEKEAALSMTPEEIAGAKQPCEWGPFPKSRCWGAFSDDSKTLMGCVNVNSYPIRFDGKQLMMGGIGGVSTLPPYRRGGVIRSCITAAFRQMMEDGFAFSYLYPFSQAYYRQFGFEASDFVQDWQIRLSALKTHDPGGTIEQLFPGDDLSPLTVIYNEFFKDCNLSVIRKEFDPSLPEQDLLGQQRYLYLWRNGNGQPRGFFLSKKQGRAMECAARFPMRNAFLALDVQAYEALFHFVRTAFSSHYDEIHLKLPDYIPLSYLVSEGNGIISCQRHSNGMVRAVSVPLVLENCRCKGSGRIKIAVSDPVLPENTGTWALEFAEGLPNRVSLTAEAPDISLPIGTFSALICGGRTADQLPMMPEAAVFHPDAPFDQVFYAKPSHVMDLF